ncbi:MAG: glycosyltransferase [Synechococcales cyanobacterium CRU_2_2]|nr:glycosyltransferase [Synechococcales cyanobacterium CRU_2_2]
MFVSIGIATYQRPQELKRLIDSLSQLKFEAIATPQIEIIVVENDSQPLTQDYCLDSQQHGSPWPIKYSLEPQRGLSYVRNAIIDNINPESDFLAFIDDDEVVTVHWLEALIQTQVKFSADVVSGPVIHLFSQVLPDWVRSANLFPLVRYPTGTKRPIAFTCNVMIRAQLLKDQKNRFDRRFALSGGEDTHFFMRIYRQGCRIVWCDEALVYDHMPSSRMTMKWFLVRNYRNYGSHSFCEKELDLWYKVFPKRFATGMGRIIIGSICFLVGIPLFFWSRKIVIEALLQIARGLGILAGLLGIQYQEYQNVHSA